MTFLDLNCRVVWRVDQVDGQAAAQLTVVARVQGVQLLVTGPE